ncbi:LuxR C-terminal-related transcriptional regulator [Humibacillus xanthopallidus]|uniref:LuxR C-terminal-related transcriptional regulator n=1 Tax=Humibacillus xanthopallidus TaxID=412689 RepID=UPI00384D4E79
MLLDAMSTSLTARGHEVVAQEVTPEGALVAVARHDPDICLLDYSYPHGTCLEVLRTMTAEHPRTRVVVFSAMTDPQTVGACLTAGAAGFVSKLKSIDDICQALDRAGSGGVAIDAHLLQQVLKPASGEDPLWALQFLTDREWDALRSIVQGLTTKQIAAELGISQATARTHVQRLLAKLGVHSRLEAAALINRHATSETWPVRLRRSGLKRGPSDIRARWP